MGCRYSGTEAGRRASGTDADPEVRVGTGPAVHRVRGADSERHVVTERSAAGHDGHLDERRADVTEGQQVLGQGRRTVRSDRYQRRRN